jgi:hypothetical protein
MELAASQAKLLSTLSWHVSYVKPSEGNVLYGECRRSWGLLTAQMDNGIIDAFKCLKNSNQFRDLKEVLYFPG